MHTPQTCTTLACHARELPAWHSCSCPTTTPVSLVKPVPFTKRDRTAVYVLSPQRDSRVTSYLAHTLGVI